MRLDTSGSQKQSREPRNAADDPGTPGKKPSRRRSCPATGGPAFSDSQRSRAPSLGAGGGPVPQFQQWIHWRCSGLRALSTPAASGEFGQGGRGPLLALQPTTPHWRGTAVGISRGHQSGGGRKRERKRGAPGLPLARSGKQHSLGEGVRLADPRGCGWLWDPRPPRPRSAPPPSPVPRRPAVPRFSRRTRTGQARDSGSQAGGRAVRGGPGADGGVISCRPAPRRPAPSEARTRPNAGLIPE